LASQAFTKNHRDHSNDNGFQFEFFCDKCGNGFRSSFKTNALGMAASLLRAAGAIFGGSIRGAGRGAEHVKDAFRGPAWDAAFHEAIEESRPKFRQCTLCGTWVCPAICWNAERGLCETCAPNLGEHAPAMQASAALEQAREKIRNADQLRGADVHAAPAAVVSCDQCSAALAPGARFCAQCGAPTSAPTPKYCTSCGASLAASSRFCPGCGSAVSAS
jgi:hypothetical protein